jgi:hypothetical protein
MPPPATPLETQVRAHIARWKSDTIHWSSLAKRRLHPSYGCLLDLARQETHGEVERALLQELRTDPDHWFDALAAITGENPAHHNDNFDATREAWLAWGRRKGLLAEGAGEPPSRSKHPIHNNMPGTDAVP